MGEWVLLLLLLASSFPPLLTVELLLCVCLSLFLLGDIFGWFCCFSFSITGDGSWGQERGVGEG